MIWLIAEDEADIRNLVTMMCTVWGHTPSTFENGQKVWDWMDKIEAGEVKGPFPDFALMDIRMPGKRGNEIALRMRTLNELKNIPVVLMTAFALGDEEMTRMKAEYAVDHIINKPLPDFDKLRTMLLDVIKKKSEESTPAPATPPPTSPTSSGSPSSGDTSSSSGGGTTNGTTTGTSNSSSTNSSTNNTPSASPGVTS